MNKSGIILIVLFTVCFQLKSQKIVTIFLEEAISQTKPLKALDFCTNIGYVPLETSANCLIGSINKIKVTQNYIVILTSKPEIFVFRRNGKFVTQIGSRGKGPAEYNYISDIAVDDTNGELLVFATLPNKVLIYTFEGVLKKNLKYPESRMVDAVENIGPGLYLFMISNYMGSTVHSYEYFTSKGESKYNFVQPQKFETTNGGALYLKEFSFYRMNNNVFAKENILNDTIYKFTTSGGSPYVVINSGKYKCNADVRINPGLYWVRDRSKFIIMQNVFETSKYVFLEFWLLNKTYWCYYDKTLNKAFTFEKSPGIINDYDPEIPIKPVYQSGSELIGFYSSEEMLNLIRGKNLRPVTEKALGNISEEDNPVIIIAKHN